MQSSSNRALDTVKIFNIHVDMTKKTSHHHGDLREALILAGIELMEQGGPDALSLRKCAALAGVSHAAPAHHFKGLVSLKTAIVARGHRMFAQTMRDHAGRVEDDPHFQLYAICEGYIDFARTHEAVFKFMFQPHSMTPDMLDETTRNEVIQESLGSYQVLLDACKPFESIGDQPESTEIMIWSLVHGYAMLFSNPKNAMAPYQSIPDIAQILPTLTIKRAEK